MTIAIVLSGGKGTRIPREIPKQYIKVGDVPLLLYCIKTIDSSEYIDKLQIVAEERWQDRIREWLRENNIDKKFVGFSLPGDNRQLSIYNGLKDLAGLAEDSDYVFIHDGARPLLTSSIIKKSVEGMEGYDGVIPVLPMKDTVYLSENGETIDSLLNREQIFAGQAPETFLYGKYFDANKSLVDSGEIFCINGSTEPAVKAGMKMHLIDGDERNFKITTSADLERFEEIIKGQANTRT